jgi:uncharacterized protein (UPF0262 family)
MGKLADLRLVEATWSAATPLRQAEWRAVREQLLADTQFADSLDGGYLSVTPTAEAVVLEVLDEEGYVTQTFTIVRAVLAASIDEYVALIRRLDERADYHDASWFEAVDMAKRVVHDGAAQLLLQTVPQLSTELTTHRKVFTLLFSLFVDTTTLHHRGHERR